LCLENGCYLPWGEGGLWATPRRQGVAPTGSGSGFLATSKWIYGWLESYLGGRGVVRGHPPPQVVATCQKPIFFLKINFKFLFIYFYFFLFLIFKLKNDMWHGYYKHISTVLPFSKLFGNLESQSPSVGNSWNYLQNDRQFWKLNCNFPIIVIYCIQYINDTLIISLFLVT
jgi:hypothetical protein